MNFNQSVVTQKLWIDGKSRAGAVAPLAVKRPVCTMKAPSSHPTLRQWGAERERESINYNETVRKGEMEKSLGTEQKKKKVWAII